MAAVPVTANRYTAIRRLALHTEIEAASKDDPAVSPIQLRVRKLDGGRVGTFGHCLGPFSGLLMHAEIGTDHFSRISGQAG